MAEKVNYCYKVMSFKLKNTGATYQQMMNTFFLKTNRSKPKILC